MAAKDYMRLNRDNTITLDINNYRGGAFVEAVKVRDIAQVTILDRSAKKKRDQGAPDVLVEDASGGNKFITRQELVSNYVHLSGKKIVIPYMKNGVKYKVVGNCNQPYVAMMLPANMNGVWNGNKVAPGNYMVAPKLPDGTVDYEHLHPVSRKMFHKMFKIPKQQVIEANRGKAGSVSNRIRTRKSNRLNFNVPNTRPGMQQMPLINNADLSGVMDAALGGQQVNINNQNRQNVPNNNQNVGQSQQANTNHYQFKAVGRIVDDHDVTVGYKIMDRKGVVKNLSKRDVMNLCAKKLVANLMISTQGSGTAYLRGNGMREESLPKYMA